MSKGTNGGRAGGNGGGGSKSQLLAYAAKVNKTGANLTPSTRYTNEQFVGALASGGLTIERTPGYRVVAEAKRTGKEIVVTETKISKEVLTGKEIRSTKVVLRTRLK